MFYEGEHVNESASWNDAALAALLHFLPAEHGQYACKGFTLSHWFPLLNVEDTGVESRLKRVRIAVDKLIGLQFADDGSFFGRRCVIGGSTGSLEVGRLLRQRIRNNRLHVVGLGSQKSRQIRACRAS